MKIAVIGAGISGMVAAYLLCEEHDIVVFEAEDYIGGHTHTLDINLNGDRYGVDTGFIVFNEKTYPNFIELMKRLDVPWQPSDMSFSVQHEGTGLEYSPSSLNALFAQRRNLLSPTFYRMLFDALRFKRESQEILKDDNYEITLEEYLYEKKYSPAFIDHFIIPMGEAIWSTDPKKFNEFPARYFVQFFNNHGFLNVRNQPQWLVIKGGSKGYVGKLTRPYIEKVRTSSPVDSVRRFADYVEVKAKGAESESFDQVIFAAHSDQALAMLADASDAERDILGAIPYQDNRTLLHTDVSFMPRRKKAWASWNYLIPEKAQDRVAMTYNMNRLQGLSAPVEFCVTLNALRPIDPDRILAKMTYHHPVYSPKAPEAQQRHDEINGKNRTYFCGAYWGYGFHEDGVNSALAVCKYFGKTL